MLGQSLCKTRPALWSFSKFSPIARKENKILHSRIEAMHIQFAEKDRGSALAELVTVSGIGNNWCEGFSTYPRTYDLIHANGVFSLYQDKIGSNGLENSIGKKVCVMHTFRKLVLFQNLDPAYSSAEVEDIVWNALNETCRAKIV